jgi:DUF4097 and DUF4098 domain-containing protein YvlB
MTRSPALRFAAFLVTIATSLVAWAGTPIDQTRSLAADGTVSIENIAGSVTVTGWDRNEVRVTGELGTTARKLDIDGNDTRLDIRVDQPDGRGRVSPSRLEIRVPRGAAVEIDTVSADISIDEFGGRVDVETVSGDVDIAGRPARIEAESVSGDVRVALATDRADLATVSGDIDIARIEGRLDAETVSGTITVRGGELTGADLESVSGTIRCEAELVGRGDIDMETMSGALVLTVPAGISADFELSTFSGSIRSDMGPEPERTSKYAPGTEASFSTGTGGPRISLTSFSGRIELSTR